MSTGFSKHFYSNSYNILFTHRVTVRTLVYVTSLEDRGYGRESYQDRGDSDDEHKGTLSR